MNTSRRAGRHLLAALALALLPFATACTDEADPAEPAAAVASPEESVGDTGQGGAAQEAIEDRIGDSVTLNGEVAELVGQNAFTIGGDEIGENPILVVSATNPAVDEGDSVRVQGKVIEFSTTDVESDLEIDIVANEVEDFEGDPAIEASSVTMAAG
jgi:hypothetical protein